MDIAALDPAVDISFCEYLDPNNPRAVTKRPQSGKNSRPPSGMPASNRPGSYGNGNAGVLGTSSTGPNLVLSMKPKPAAGYEQLEVERYESRVTGNTLHEEEEANILMEFEKILKLSATELLAIVKVLVL